MPTIIPEGDLVQPSKKLNICALTTDEDKFKTNFDSVIKALSQIQQKQSCGCENYMKKLSEISRQTISTITRQNLCVFKRVFFMRDMEPSLKRQSFNELTNELHDAKEAIGKYIKEQENNSYSLIKKLNNAPWVSQMTRIIQNASRDQNYAAKELTKISKSVALQLNARFAQFESKMKEIENRIDKYGDDRMSCMDL